jgi:predicted membrane-bound spermidine synthase
MSSVNAFRTPVGVFFLLFTASGFAGLIYQSIWTHYLKLFLGHAAYAQSLVLAIFMGGMAVGAWLCARHAKRIRRPLIWYAVIELVIGVASLAFHTVFRASTQFAYDVAIPAIGSEFGISVLQWTLAAALILPQSILLGATFPLMTSGVMRRYRELPGNKIAMLYFTNSLGASLGVLASGFVLVPQAGLPGTLVFAGVANIVLALVVWLLVRGGESPQPTDASAQGSASPGSPAVTGTRLLLAVALMTGAASFMLEIGWIRMLSLVLGSSTHAFELMLSALILGIALGSLLIRRRIDRAGQILPLLVVVLVLKAVMAVATLPVYAASFEFMGGLFGALTRTDAAYTAFNAVSHMIAMAVMLPSAIFAGMSLPLITTELLRRGAGESAIGRVYAWNTLGAIIGVAVAVHIGLVLLGLSRLIVVAALVDVIAAALIATKLVPRQPPSSAPSDASSPPSAPARAARASLFAVATGGAALLAALLFVRFDALTLASGVYRDGKLYDASSSRSLFHRDGKTATVSVIAHQNGTASLHTNGKADAALQLSADRPPDSDEYTMTLLGALPILHRPEAKTVANIGFGSGLTTHTVLGSPVVERVDNIEIEPVMVQAAQVFKPVAARAFEDQRSKLIFEDAKRHFAAQRETYDVIISEPSNPWVSGVSGLFSREFYARAKRHLAQDGILVQWVQLYEIDERLVASILKAMASEFPHYVIYEVSISEMLIVASPRAPLAAVSARAFEMPALAAQLARLGIRTTADIDARRVMDAAQVAPALATIAIAANSDYFPLVDSNAAKTRFLGSRATAFTAMNGLESYVVDLLNQRVVPPLAAEHRAPRATESALRHAMTAQTYRIRDYVIDGAFTARGAQLPLWQVKAAYLTSRLNDCQEIARDGTFNLHLHELGRLLGAAAPADVAESVWNRLTASKCSRELSPVQQRALALYRAVSARRAEAVRAAASAALADRATYPNESVQFLLKSAMAAAIANGAPEEARALWAEHASAAGLMEAPDMASRILVGLSLSAAARP